MKFIQQVKVVNADSIIFTDLLESVISEKESIQNIWFATDKHDPPPFSYQVNFPRLEIVISGMYRNQLDDPETGITEVDLCVGDALFIPPNSWNKPDWDTTCSVLSLLFGKRQLGFSLVSKNKGDTQFYDVQKFSITARTGHAIDGILSALNSLAGEPVKHPMDNHLLLSLLTYSRSMAFASAANIKSRSEDTYQSICIYIQENFHRAISRDSIAARFNMSANHLSRLFRKQGHMRLSDYIIWVRLERAKFMLSKYPFRLHEVAVRCGFQDVNYFCRVFKTRTGKTPSEYRLSLK
ncbi:helix-turn-helix transcriptional regulator [Psychromonas ossibalaenae]|uniref:helix-turn-helix transcriptional regulator n=1 Tax=Psychromonas ossibalaenae TaxID=444922 RepID=UPI00037187B9|nr:AraC family transcriptional regulator [Psychromonas ossibalaenae]